MNKIKLLLADDEELFRKGISFLLQRQDNIQILYEANNGSEVVEYLKSSSIHPDIILMDLKMPMLNGVEATKLINKEFPSIKIIALTIYNTNYNMINQISPIANSAIFLNGVTLINQTSNFYNYLQPYNYYNATPQIGTNVYSFSLNPTEMQPSAKFQIAGNTSEPPK
jgi:CheY-like chemotaxis protein